MSTEKKIAIILLTVYVIGVTIMLALRNQPKQPVKPSVQVVTITKEDSLRIARNTLINERGKISEYDILPDGTWKKRVKQIKIINGTDTIYVDTSTTPPVYVSSIDTSYNYIQDSAHIQTNINGLYAIDSNALKFNYTTSIIKEQDSSYYKLLLQIQYMNNQWKLAINENFLFKSKTTETTIKEYIPTYSKELRPFWSRFSYGPIMGVGLGVLTHSVDIFIGGGIFFDLNF